MAVLRFLSALFLLVALVALAADLTPTTPDKVGLHAASVHQRWSEMAPAVLAASQQSFNAAGLAAVWTWLVSPLLALPAFVVFGGLALATGYAGRRRRRINVFIN